MESELKIIGTTNEELKQGLNLALIMSYGRYLNDSDYDVGVTYWGFDSSNNTMCFRNSESEICNNRFPVVMNLDMIYPIIEKYLSGFSKDERIGDGSTGRGFIIEKKPWNLKYDFSVSFKTIYYGK